MPLRRPRAGRVHPFGRQEGERSGLDWSAAWVDLLVDDAAGADVLFVGDPTRRAAERLRTLAASMVTVDHRDVAARRGAAPVDVVVIDGSAPPPDLDIIGGLVAPGGIVAVLADHGRSPLWLADRLAGRLAGGNVITPGALGADVRRAGCSVERRFGLLRSSLAPVTAVALDAPITAAAVLDAAATRVGRVRATLLRVLRFAVEHEVGHTLFPAMLVVARRGPTRALDPDRVTGRIGYLDSEESVVVRGEPPRTLDKRYRRAGHADVDADAEALALSVLAASPFVPDLVSRAGPDVVRQRWMAGRSLNPHHLTPAGALAWAERAATTLGHLQALSARPDGTVMVHGDYWLGNVLVDGDDVVAVIDWTEAHWGDVAEDVEHLTTSLVAGGSVSDHDHRTVASRLHAAAGRARAAPCARRAARRSLMVRIEAVTNLDEVRRLAPEWQALADEGDVTYCCHPWWAVPWFEHHGSGRPLVVTADDDGALVGVLPLHERTIGPVRVARVVGHGLGGVGEVIHRPGDEQIGSAIWSWLTRDQWRFLDLRNVRDRTAAAGAGVLSGGLAPEPADRCPTLAVPDDLGSFLATRSKRLRKNLRRAERRMTERGQVHTVEVHGAPDDLAVALGEVETLYAAAEAGNPRQHLLSGRWEGFTRSVLREASRQGRLLLFVGRLDGRAISFDIGFVGANRVELWIGRIDASEADLSPGHLALAKILATDEVRAAGTVDLGLGDDGYKRLWTDDGYATVDVVGARGAVTGRIAEAALAAVAARSRAGSRPTPPTG